MQFQNPSSLGIEGFFSFRERYVMGPTVAEIKQKMQQADAAEFAVLERSLIADTRKGVRAAVESARKRLAALEAEQQRLEGMYAGLNDSKQVKPEERERIAEQVKQVALTWTVQFIEPGDIDAHGMTASLTTAFCRAIAAVEAQGVQPEVVLLDGNPLHLDAREINVVKGDGKCASIAAASIVAKVERDALMCEYAKRFPAYDFASNKGYASAAHIEAIKQQGLCPIHRVSFCHAFTQESLF